MTDLEKIHRSTEAMKEATTAMELFEAWRINDVLGDPPEVIAALDHHERVFVDLYIQFHTERESNGE
jgi:hypothetical protein